MDRGAVDLAFRHVVRKQSVGEYVIESSYCNVSSPPTLASIDPLRTLEGPAYMSAWRKARGGMG
jgi:hypothetical protein